MICKQNLSTCTQYIPRNTDAQRSLFSPKYQTFGLGQTIWANKFWGIWGIFGQFISTLSGTVSPLSMFFVNQTLVLQKNEAFISESQIFVWDWDLNQDSKELGIQSSRVRSPWYIHNRYHLRFFQQLPHQMVA